MQGREFRDGAQDGLEALEPFDPEKVKSFSDLLAAMKKTAFGGRRLGEAFEVLAAMIEDRECFVVLTLSGAMTIAKMGKIISTMIDHGMIQSIVSTGALIAHGLSESVGKTHYRYDPAMSDEELFHKGYNRVYDTLEMESHSSALQSLSRFEQLYGSSVGRQALRYFYNRRRGSEKLGSAGRAVCGDRERAYGTQCHSPAVSIWCPHLSGAGLLGGAQRVHVHRRHFMGKVCPSSRGWTFCGSAQRRDCCLAALDDGPLRTTSGQEGVFVRAALSDTLSRDFDDDTGTAASSPTLQSSA